MEGESKEVHADVREGVTRTKRKGVSHGLREIFFLLVFVHSYTNHMKNSCSQSIVFVSLKRRHEVNLIFRFIH